MNRSNIVKRLFWAGVACFLVAAPFILSNIYWTSVLIPIGINVLLTVSLRTMGLIGHFSLGHVGFMLIGAYTSALLVMNDILGGGGFSSRILQRVRYDEGLAYNAGSTFDRPVLYPGTFRALFQTKHATAAFGTRIMVDEIKRIRKELCDKEAVDNSKAKFISNLVNPFSSKRAKLK